MSLSVNVRGRRARKAKRCWTAIHCMAQPPTPPATPAATAAPAAPAAPIAATSKAQRPTGPTDSKGRDEKYWRDAFAKARQEVKRLQDRLSVLQLKANDLTTRIRSDSIYMRAMAEQEELDKTNQDLAIAQHELNVAQQKVADLEEELRRSGGLPGWA